MNLKLAMTVHAFQATPIFRSVSDTHSGAVLHTPAGDRRPVRIPLEVDNIWEWVRQPQFPSRRSCAFGSPSGALAAASGPADGRVCRVLIKPPAQVIQLRGIPDARGHPDLHALRAVLRAHEQMRGRSGQISECSAPTSSPGSRPRRCWQAIRI